MSGPGLPLGDSAEELYEHAPCGYLSTLPDGTVVRANETFLRWTGFAREDLVDTMRFQELLTPGGRIFHETHIAPMLRMQGAVRELALELDCPAGRLPVLVNAVVKADDAGAPLLTRIMLLDATERRGYERELLAARDAERTARRRTERLQRVTAGLASALDARRVAAVLVDELVGELGADRAVVALLLGDGELQLVGFHGPGLVVPVAQEPLFAESREAGPGEPQALAVLPALAGDRALGVVGLGWPAPREFDAADRTFLAAVAAQGGQALERALLHEATVQAAQSAELLARAARVLGEAPTVAARAQGLVDVLVPDLADLALVELLVDGRRRRWQAGDDAALTSATGDRRVEVTLPAHGGTSGTLTLCRGPERAFRPDQGPFLEDLAARAGLALEHARLAEHERDVAQALQRSILDGRPPHDARLGVATLYRPAVAGLEVGGDWYDAFRLDDDRVAVVVGDVVGRGVHAASAMGQLRSAVRALAIAGLGPAAVLERLDAYVEHLPAGRMATVAYAELDLAAGRLRLACAGHPPPLVTAAAGPTYLWGGRSAPLGAYLRPATRGECEVTLRPGDRLLLYTDGLVERRDRAMDTGLVALASAYARTTDRPLGEVTTAVADALLAGAQTHDDVCVLCVGYGVTEAFERDVAADPAALAPLRADLRTWLAGNDVPPDERDAVVLACGEAVANSIEHGYGADRRGVVAVRGRVHGPELELRVADEGAWRPPHGLADRGRGLLIIGKLMDEVSVSRVGGTTVHMRRGLRRG